MKKRFKRSRKADGPILSPDPHDRVVVRLPCYEPAGQIVPIDEGTLLRSMLLVGQTGSGKSSTLNKILSDLIGYRADEPAYRPGLVIMDNQADQILKIRHMAAKVGRENDILHLSPDAGWYRPLGHLKSWADLDRATGRLISASGFIEAPGSDNRYWSETTRLLLESCLIVMMVTSPEVQFSSLLQFLTHWLVSGKKPPIAVAERIAFFHSIAKAARPKLSAAIETKISFAVSTFEMWETLDTRTKGILRSCAATVLNPFISVYGLRFWDEQRSPLIDPALVVDGKIVVISVPAAVEPELATMLGRLAKMDFYEAAQRRSYRPGDRIVAMVQDEYPYSVTGGSSRWSDITNLATIRGRGACLIAATQGIANLELAVGSREVNALRLNFSNLLFYRSQEPALDAWAEQLFGLKSSDGSNSKEPRKDGFWPSPPLEEIIAALHPQADQFCCPRGALSRLETHQAYISLANGFRTEEPLWLAPHHIDVGPADSPPVPIDQDMQIIAETRNDLMDAPDEDFFPHNE